MIKLFKLITFCLLGLVITAHAALDLVLTQGVDKALPIAIVPFINDNTISDVITSDLQNSGVFRVIDNTFANVSTADYEFWQQQKINNVVTGKVQFAGFKRKVSFQLLDVYNKAILLDKNFTVFKKEFRALAHHISDLVYQQLTGIKGIFSTRIAYVLVQRTNGKPARYKLMVADADGHNPKIILSSYYPIMSPAWSPDAKKIAYVSFEGNRAAVYAQNIATGKRELLSKAPGINGAPAWSPDMTKLALVLTNTGYPKIYVLDLTNGKLQQMTSGMALDTEPAWSPDGGKIIFTSNRGGGPQIYQVDVQSNDVQRLTYEGNYNARASFAPDGKSIVMLHHDSGMFNIAVQALASGRISILTRFGLSESPSIAPNGQMIVYATNYAGRGVLGEVSIDGKVKLRLPAQEGEVQEPAWSPFLD